MSTTQFAGLGLLAFVVCSLLPALLVFLAPRVRPGERLAWILAVVFTSWPGFVAFLVVNTLDPRPRPLASQAARRPRRVIARDISDHSSAG